jgi:hypothetical protein
MKSSSLYAIISDLFTTIRVTGIRDYFYDYFPEYFSIMIAVDYAAAYEWTTWSPRVGSLLSISSLLRGSLIRVVYCMSDHTRLFFRLFTIILRCLHPGNGNVQTAILDPIMEEWLVWFDEHQQIELWLYASISLKKLEIIAYNDILIRDYAQLFYDLYAIIFMMISPIILRLFYDYQLLFFRLYALFHCIWARKMGICRQQFLNQSRRNDWLVSMKNACSSASTGCPGAQT